MDAVFCGQVSAFFFCVYFNRDKLPRFLDDGLVFVGRRLQFLAPPSPICIEIEHDQLFAGTRLLRGCIERLRPGHFFLRVRYDARKDSRCCDGCSYMNVAHLRSSFVDTGLWPHSLGTPTRNRPNFGDAWLNYARILAEPP
jgi:hypothetical protein